jgi:hypothetical protein
VFDCTVRPTSTVGWVAVTCTASAKAVFDISNSIVSTWPARSISPVRFMPATPGASTKTTYSPGGISGMP